MTMLIAEAIWARTAARGQVDRAREHHRFEAGEGVAGGVGVNRGHAAVVAAVHRLEHVQGGGVTDLADDDPVGAHPKAVAEELPDRKLSPPLDIGRTELHRHQVGVPHLELGGVLDGDHPLLVRDHRPEHIEGGGLARAGASETISDNLPLTTFSRKVAIAGLSDPSLMRSSRPSWKLLNLRGVMAGPRIAAGG